MPAPASPGLGRDTCGVRVDRRPPVLLITIDRVHVRNALDLAAAEALAAALAALDDDPDLAVGVLTGAGGIFSAGKDLKSAARGEPEAFVGDRGFAGLTRHHPRRPLIAAVEGPALGGGFELALACDLIVAARDAFFGQPEVSRGLVATEGGMVRLPRRLPHAIAMEILLTGDRLAAPDAARWGLVNRLTEPGGALRAALELAGRIARNAPLALRTTTAVVRAMAGLPERTAFAVQDELTAPLWGSADIEEGFRAFFERRMPRWQGR
jgi:enoyl-CoA hydratase